MYGGFGLWPRGPSDDEELREQERRLKNTTAQRVFYIAAVSIIVLLSIVSILGANVFHFW